MKLQQEIQSQRFKIFKPINMCEFEIDKKTKLPFPVHEVGCLANAYGTEIKQTCMTANWRG